jgi:hypothetical protein
LSASSVEFGGQRQTHAAPGLQIGHLLFGQRLDRTRLHARVGRLRESRDARQDQGGGGKE